MNEFENELRLSVLDEVEDTLSALATILHGDNESKREANNSGELLRLIHSIKGNAMAANFESLAKASHAVESLAIKMGECSSEGAFPWHVFEEYHGEACDCLPVLRIGSNDEGLFTRTEQCLREAESDASNVRASSNQELCLIVDDEPEILRLLAHEVQSSTGLVPQFAKNGKEAVELAKNTKFKVILTDYKMPKMNGIDFIKTLRVANCLNYDTPVVMITAFKPNLEASPELWRDVFFILKPWSIGSLKLVIRCAMNLTNKAA